MSSMSSRPTRQSALDALEKIRGVLAWESCSEKSEAFQAAAEQMEREFANAKRRRVAARSDPVSDDENDVEDESEDDESEDDASDDDDSGCESESGAESVGSAPSSADLYSDPGESSDDDSLSEAKSSDVGDAQDVAIEVLDSPAKSQPVDV
jgi:hypothetical protein